LNINSISTRDKWVLSRTLLGFLPSKSQIGSLKDSNIWRHVFVTEFANQYAVGVSDVVSEMFSIQLLFPSFENSFQFFSPRDGITAPSNEDF
jgi:hypothetical protein